MELQKQNYTVLHLAKNINFLLRFVDRFRKIENRTVRRKKACFFESHVYTILKLPAKILRYEHISNFANSFTSKILSKENIIKNLGINVRSTATTKKYFFI